MSKLRITSARSNGFTRKHEREERGTVAYNDARTLHVNFKNFRERIKQNEKTKESKFRMAEAQLKDETEDVIQSPVFSAAADVKLQEIVKLQHELSASVKEGHEKQCKDADLIDRVRREDNLPSKSQCRELIRQYEIHNRKLERCRAICKKYEDLKMEIERMRAQEERFKREFVARVWTKYDPIYGTEEMGQTSIFNAVWASFKPSKRN